MTLPKNADAKPAHGMSVDIEDWFQVWALSERIERADWDDCAFRVAETTSRLLDLFAERGATSTFFVLGWVAERMPDVIRRMVEDGHELASHGYEHIKVFDQDAAAFRDDVLRTKKILEDIGGAPVVGYRAAGFSIDQRTPFAHEVLAETGHRYSSSTHPISHDHYGDPNGSLLPYQAADGLLEIPVAVRDFPWGRQSCAGGGWFRAVPYGLSRQMWRGLEASGRRGVFYFHPWEIDPGQPKVDGLSLKSKIRHRLNLDRMEAKVSRLLDDFSWARIDHVFADEIAAVADTSSEAAV